VYRQIASYFSAQIAICKSSVSDAKSADDDSIAVAAAPAIDMPAMSLSNRLTESPSATTLYRATTGEYDLRPLGDDLPTGEGDELLVDILAESLPPLPL